MKVIDRPDRSATTYAIAQTLLKEKPTIKIDEKQHDYYKLK